MSLIVFIIQATQYTLYALKVELNLFFLESLCKPFGTFPVSFRSENYNKGLTPFYMYVYV